MIRSKLTYVHYLQLGYFVSMLKEESLQYMYHYYIGKSGYLGYFVSILQDYHQPIEHLSVKLGNFDLFLFSHCNRDLNAEANV